VNVAADFTSVVATGRLVRAVATTDVKSVATFTNLSREDALRAYPKTPILAKRS
jgi:hypothetical protein